jgi:hypothetical protein
VEGVDEVVGHGAEAEAEITSLGPSADDDQVRPRPLRLLGQDVPGIALDGPAFVGHARLP